MPALAPAPPVFYRRYRSGTRPDAPEPGCIVAVSVEFDGPDEARQRAWVDAVFDALASEPEPPAGGIGAHFHVSTDGTRVLNYAEWVDEASHVAALERSGIGAIGRGRNGGRCRLPGPESEPRDAVSPGSAPRAGVCRRRERMSGPLRVAVIIGSTRPGRLGPSWPPGSPIRPRRMRSADRPIDLADTATPVGPRLAGADAFVVVTPEYSHCSRRP